MADATPLKLTNGIFGQFASGDVIPTSFLPVDTDGTLSADSDSLVPTQRAAKAYSDDLIALAKFGGYRLPSVAVDDYVCLAPMADTVSTQWHGSTAASVNQTRFIQFAIGYTAKTDRLRLECTQAATTGSLRLGIFADNAGRPGTVVAQGTVAWAVGMLEATFTEATLTPGVYWGAAKAEHTAASTGNPLYRGVQRGPVNVGWPSPSSGSSYYPDLRIAISGSFADNPTPNFGTSTASMLPYMFMKVTARP